MRCDQIRELILTDYVDTQMPQDKREAIEKHLAGCEKCFEFVFNVRRTAVEPFFGAKRGQVSQESVWRALRERIEAENKMTAQTNPIVGLWNQFKESFYFPKPAWVLSMAFILLLVATIFFIKPHPQNQYAKETIEQESQYFVDMIGEFDLASDENNGGYETAIEEYFL